MKASLSRFAGLLFAVCTLAAMDIGAQQDGFDGLYMNLGNLFRLSGARTRSISPENFTGEPGRGGMATDGTGKLASRDLGQKWKVSPSVNIQPKQVFTMASIQGPGAIQHIWMTPTGNWRFSIIRFYWDGEETPSIECPVGDFFAMGWGRYAQISSLPVAVNPGSAFNCYWVMPFRKSCKITMENLDDKQMTLYYQITYALTGIPSDAAYLHTQFRRSNPLPEKTDHVLLEGVRGQGQYVGTYLAWGSRNSGWWGEGEIKFFMDGDTEFPTICGTGTEDYFCDGVYASQMRFGMYRWHIMDPIRFESALKVTIQALGWKSGGRYLPLRDDLASTVFWYQKEPHAAFPKLPARDELEVN
ncbi:MAG: hypothetical protein H6Q06_993 [Acidobacteria bacterium]|nr:hypothetical protein [Acidobacteriota bacterium]